MLPYWSLYAQYATGFLIPALSTLQVSNLPLNASINYQAGTVFTRGRITADVDIYTIKLSNFAQPDPTGQFYMNAGNARYSGVEDQATYAFDFGLAAFVNGSLNSAENLTSNVEVPNAPKWTDAAGLMYNHDCWQGALTFKEVGAQSYGAGELKAYNSLNAIAAYDFGHFKLKLSGFNLADHRAVTSFSGAKLYSTSDSGLYQFQAGREVQVTLQAKF